VQQSRLKITVLSLMLTAASLGWAQGSVSTVSGVVRDSQGVAQMGALVQVIANDSAMVGTAFTDLHGRYLIANLLPGKYEVRATAALFVPALKGNLQLRPGVRAVVNLTLNSLFDTSSWLPAERRKADEPADDWTWTLRSAANRPILRLATDDSDTITISSSATEPVHPADHARAAVMSGDGGFGTGGVHNVFLLNRTLTDGSEAIFRADLGALTGSIARAPATDVQAGYERRLGFAGSARTVVSYQSHPEMVGSGGATNYEAGQFATAQKTELGDTVELEVGGDVYFVRTAGTALASRPFLKVTAHPTSNWSANYHMATSRNLQSFEGLDSVELELPVAVATQGSTPQLESGLHQQWGVARKTGRGSVEISYYRDDMNRIAISGGGQLSADDLMAVNNAKAGILADTATDTFQTMGPGYHTQGFNVLLTEPITGNLWLAVEYATGAALTADDSAIITLPPLPIDLKARASEAATVAIKGRVVHTGTKVRASYRWQPDGTITAVNAFAPFSDQAYLSFVVRQPIRCGNKLPSGLEATVDVSNLLAEGYRPFLSSDGKTLYLAQTPRTIQAGLAFNF
jgi:Carboxypeptidase regulatory-like domain